MTLQELFKSPLFNLSKLNRVIGAPTNTLGHVRAETKPLPAKWYWPLFKELVRNGIHLYGYTWEYLEEDDMFYLFNRLEGADTKDEEVIEHETPTSSWFEYRISINKVLITDSVRLIQLVQSLEKNV